MRLLEELAWDLQPLVAAAPASARCVVDPLDGSVVLGDLDESELPRFALSTRQLSKTRSRIKRQRLLDAKTNRPSPSPSAPTLTIFDAVESASLDDAQFLLLQGADLHAREPRHQRTALHMLAVSRDAPLAARVAMLDFLLDRAKLDLHARDATGQSPLLAFAAGGCLSLVEAVVARDAALWRATDHGGRNAFHGACAHDQPEVAAWLQHFVLQPTDTSLTDLHARDASGSTPLHTLAARGHGECLDAVVAPLSDELRAALLQERDARGCRPLHLAVAGGHADVVRDLLRLGASPLVGDAWARRPLHYASTMELMSLLVEHGADLNAADARGDTALHYAAASGRGAGVRHLLVLGADPTVLNSDWQRAAQVAASPDCTRLLLPSASASSVSLSHDDLLASAKSYCLPTAMEPPSKVARETLIDWDKLHADHDVELVDDCGHFSSDDEREDEWVSDDE
jgi:ankyrin repeat protein